MKDEPIYIVKMQGMFRDEDLERFKKKIEQQLDGKIVIIDSRIEYIEQLEPKEASELVELLYEYTKYGLRKVEK